MLCQELSFVASFDAGDADQLELGLLASLSLTLDGHVWGLQATINSYVRR